MFFTDMSEVIDRKAGEVFNKATPTRKLRERAEKDGALLSFTFVEFLNGDQPGFNSL